MKNYVQSGNKLTISAPYNVVSGQLVVLRSLFGVAIVDALQGQEVTIDTQGIFELAKEELEVTTGSKAYYHEEAGLLTSNQSHDVVVEGQPDGDGSPTTNTQTVNHPLVGVFVKDAKTDDKKAQVKLAQSPC